MTNCTDCRPTSREYIRRVVRALCFIAAILALLPTTARSWSPLVVPFCPLGAFQDSLFHAGRVLGIPFHRRTPRHCNETTLTARPELPAGVQRIRRRFLLQVICGSVAGSLWAGAARAMRITMPRPLRPPGAQEDTTFVGLCVRCGNCMRVCPSRIIGHDGADHGIAGLFAPVVRFLDDYCREDCVRCTEVCPSGALVRQSLANKHQTHIGLPRVDMNVCLLGMDQECAACRNACPYEAIMLVFSEVDYTLTPVIDPHKCPGCGACQVACPTKPVKAIQVYVAQKCTKASETITSILQAD
jgi:ferredoxin-type protein NapF